MENYPVMVNPEGPLYSKAVGIRFKVPINFNIFMSILFSVYYFLVKNNKKLKH